MTNQQILEKAIQKAVEGGWDVDPETVLPEMQKKWSLYGLQYTGYSGLLFSKDFAKALWGDQMIPYAGPADGELAAFHIASYLHHLQQMVIAPDPIQYLGENI